MTDESDRTGYREEGRSDRGHGTGDRGYMTGDRGQGTGDRGQGTGDKGQGTGDRGQGTLTCGLAAYMIKLVHLIPNHDPSRSRFLNRDRSTDAIRSGDTTPYQILHRHATKHIEI